MEILIVYENLDTMRYILRVHGAEGNGAENGTHPHLHHDEPVGTVNRKHHLNYTGLYSFHACAMSIHKLGYTLRRNTFL